MGGGVGHTMAHMLEIIEQLLGVQFSLFIMQVPKIELRLAPLEASAFLCPLNSLAGPTEEIMVEVNVKQQKRIQEIVFTW